MHVCLFFHETSTQVQSYVHNQHYLSQGVDDESFVLLIERILSFAMPCARCQVFVQEPWWRLEWTPTASGWRFYCPCCKESLSGERCLTSRPVFFFEDDVNWNVYVSHDGHRWWCNTEESVYFWESSASWTRHMCPLSKRCWWCNPNGMSQLCDWKCLFVASNVYGSPCGPRSGVDFILLKISGTCMFFWRWRMSFEQRRQRTHLQVARDKWRTYGPRPDRCLCSRALCRCVPEGTLLPECFLWNVEV